MKPKSNFKDHFSSLAENYAQYRPGYPDELFAYLSSLCKEHHVAWDCATGSGQAALSLTPYFEKVIGSDASKNQLEHATKHPKLEYIHCPAENTPLADHSVDLVTVAQALHWFDHPQFFNELHRVAKKSATAAFWFYELCTVNPEIDLIINKFYDKIVGPYWPEERRYIDTHYTTIKFPFRPMEVPEFKMVKQWTWEEMKAYLHTWSAVKHYKNDKKSDPVDIIDKPLKQLYKTKLTVSWPITLVAGKITPS